MGPGHARARVPGPARAGPVTAALALAGVDVLQLTVRGMLHGFLNLPAEVEPVRRCLDLIAGTITRGGL